MDDHHITVKLLDGRKLTVEWERGWTVRALKRKLAGERGSLRYCKLYHNGVLLNNHQSIGDLGISEQGFLVAIEGKPKASNPETPSAAPVDSPPRHAVQDNIPSCALQRSPGKLDTLLPGYTSRPFPSPRKQRGFEASHSTAEQHEDNETDEGGSRSLCQTADPKTRTSREGSEFQDLDPTALASFPLPPILQRLEEAFGIIAVHYEFLVQRHIQPTLKALCSAIEGSVGHSPPGVLQDLRLVSMLCPYVVRFESLTKSEDQDTSAIIALADPKLHKDVSNGIPASFLETIQPKPKGCETQTESENGSLKKKKKTSKSLRPNKFARMAWCLRVAGLRTVCGIQAEVMKTRQAKANDVELTAGHWHPDFSLTDDVTKESLLKFLISQKSDDMKSEDDQGKHKGTKRRKMDGKVPAPPRLFSTPSKHPPCMDSTPMDAEQFLKHLCSFPRYQGRVVHVHHLPQRTAQYGTPVPPLSKAIASGLRTSRGINQLYTHQARAITALRASQHTVIATSTASGKSLCYTIPIFEAIAADPSACAILMYPTKALAQDQLRALRDLAQACFSKDGTSQPPSIDIYDGDTPLADRGEVRDRAQILLTNPDMLHVSILPTHSQFKRILSKLCYVVIDEAHMYRGVFGAHVAMVIRRLRRICGNIYSKEPTFALTTATIANPSQHAAALIGLPDADSGGLTVIGAAPDEDGSPCGEKHFVLWNPPLTTPNPSPKIKKRAVQEAGREVVRRTRQARHAPPLLGSCSSAVGEDGEEDSAWRNAVAVGRRRNLLGWNGSKRHATKGSVTTAVKDRCEQGSGSSSHILKVGRSRYGAAGVDSQERRTSPIVEVSILLSECVQHGLRTIAFCKTRKLSELVTAYVREILLETAPHLAGSAVAVYRSGYSPEERREIEDGLFRGRLLAVAATNALELGVDVGGLDVTLHLGFPGSIASLWQQAGRAGRRERASVSVYVGWDGPLDQYFMNDPSKLFGRPIEAAAVDPKNRAVLEAHLACAAAELPLIASTSACPVIAEGHTDVRDIDLFGGEDTYEATLVALQEKGIVGRHPAVRSAWHFTGAGGCYGNTDNPASRITLRAIDPGRYTIVDESQDGKVLEEVEENKAFYQVYDGAVYMFQGRTYLCKALDLDAKVAIVRPADLKYYTKPVDFTRVTVVGGEVSYQSGGTGGTNAKCTNAAGSCSGKAVVTTKWMGFVRIWRGNGQVFDSVDLFLPDVSYETEATFIRLGPQVRQAVEAAGLPFRDGIHAASHAILNALPLFLMCNPQDVGTECDNPYDTQYKPERLLIFDKHPGGIGLAISAGLIFGDLLHAALKLIQQCDCTSVSGCPGCIQHLDCGEYNAVLHKESGRIILQETLLGIVDMERVL